MNDFIPSFFDDFIRYNVDRFSVLQNILSDYHIPFKTVTIRGSKHVVVMWEKDRYQHGAKKQVLIAHYDRTLLSPGANDNSAACCQLLEYAVSIENSTTCTSKAIIFTDHEEASFSIKKQGAYSLGLALQKTELANAYYYVFDVTGCGDTLIMSKTGLDVLETKLKCTPLYTIMKKRHEELSLTLRHEFLSNFMELSIPFSDNIGLLTSGLPCYSFTILPKEEAHTLMKWLVHNPNAFLHTSYKDYLRNPVTSNYLPKTWKTLHSRQDTKEQLTKNAFVLMNKLLKLL